MDEYLTQMIDSKTSNATYARITTMTILASLNRDIDIGAIKASKPVSINGTEWKVKENTFYNQVTIETHGSFSKKSIKIFPNGSIHVTGCSDMIDCRAILKKLEVLVNFIFPEVSVPYSIDEFYIAMINANFTMMFTMNLRKVLEIFKEFDVSFNPETYSAVKLKRLGVTASIFASGSVIITGAKELDQIIETYRFLIKELVNAKMDPLVNKDLDQFNSFRGFTFDQWREHLVTKNE